MLNHRNFVSNWCLLDTTGIPDYQEQQTHLCFLPLPHLYERSLEFFNLFKGYYICYFCGDVTKIGEDIMYFKPNVLPLVPRLLNKYYAAI